MSFQRILFVSAGARDDESALLSALHIAKTKNADLDVLLLVPKLPSHFTQYVQPFTNSLMSKFSPFIEQCKSKMGFMGNINIRHAAQGNPAVAVIKQVLENDYDLVIKQVDASQKVIGFEAMDMSLLRKCPCALMLCRPKHQLLEGKFAVAIDPESEEEAGDALSRALLKATVELATQSQATADVLSCWDFTLQGALTHDTWLSLDASELEKEREAYCRQHLAAVKALVGEVEGASAFTVEHLNGLPFNAIPEYTREQNTDLLIMGTVARTGLEGFIMGNTAENILQSLECSLLALKPAGFVSPIKLH